MYCHTWREIRNFPWFYCPLWIERICRTNSISSMLNIYSISTLRIYIPQTRIITNVGSCNINICRNFCAKRPRAIRITVYRYFTWCFEVRPYSLIIISIIAILITIGRIINIIPFTYFNLKYRLWKNLRTIGG